MDQYIVRCRLLVSHADDKAGQAALRDYLKASGPQSIKAALEAAPRNLGGACDDLNVQRASGYGMYEHNGNHYYGAEFTVLIDQGQLAINDPMAKRIIHLKPMPDSERGIDEFDKNQIYFEKDPGGTVSHLVQNSINRFNRVP